MRIALFIIRNLLASHYSLFGYRETLERMGHTVLECAFPSNNVQVTPEIISRAPGVVQLLECDICFSTYHEYVQPWLERIYPLEQWLTLMNKVPVIARFDESMDRGDLWLPHRMPTLKKWATHYSFPAAQDAEKYGGEWLPYGADTTIFNPGTEWQFVDGPKTSFNTKGKMVEGPVGKKYDLGFIGTLYPKRQEYLQKLIMHVGKKTTFYCGNVIVHDLGGIRERETTELLAENYRQIRIFFCLPPMSRLLVEKIFDVMACDTMVMYPRFPDDAAKNLSLFEDEKHIVYYELGFFANNGKQVKYYLEHHEEVKKIACAGGELVRSEYTLEQMLAKMLAMVEKEQPNETIRQIAGSETA
jgi:hypothetical protein